jgi:hypothetical protein
MGKIVGAKIIGELRARMDQEAADKNCSLSELIRQKILFAYEHEEKEKTIINLKKIESDIKSLMNLLIMNCAFMADYIRKEKGVDAWVKIFNTAKEILEDYKKTGKLSI